MFVKVTNGQIDKFPYTAGDLRRDNPNVSFPKHIPEEMMADYGVYPVSHGPAPEYNSGPYKIIRGSTPVLINGVWVLEKLAVALTDQEVSERNAASAEAIRSKRDNLLAETDWVVIKAQETGVAVDAAWATYRQALRDITTHANWPHLTEADWPIKP